MALNGDLRVGDLGVGEADSSGGSSSKKRKRGSKAGSKLKLTHIHTTSESSGSERRASRLRRAANTRLATSLVTSHGLDACKGYLNSPPRPTPE